MKFLKVEMLLVFLLLLGSCGKSGGGSSDSSGNPGSSGDEAVTVDPKIQEGKRILSSCYSEWFELKEEMRKNSEELSATFALGFVGNECLKVKDFNTLERVLEVYKNVDPLTPEKTNWIKAALFVKLKGE